MQIPTQGALRFTVYVLCSNRVDFLYRLLVVNHFICNILTIPLLLFVHSQLKKVQINDSPTPLFRHYIYSKMFTIILSSTLPPTRFRAQSLA